MKINPINSVISFGKIPVAEFNIDHVSSSGERTKIPVIVSRSEEKDYNKYYTEERTKKLYMFRLFNNRKPDSPDCEDYFITSKTNDELLGCANCIKEGDRLNLEIIGTSTNKDYKGIGRALLAGIAADTKGKLKSLNVPVFLDKAYLFYKKCHFDYNSEQDALVLQEDKFDSLIQDAQKI